MVPVRLAAGRGVDEGAAFKPMVVGDLKGFSPVVPRAPPLPRGALGPGTSGDGSKWANLGMGWQGVIWNLAQVRGMRSAENKHPGWRKSTSVVETGRLSMPRPLTQVKDLQKSS